MTKKINDPTALCGMGATSLNRNRIIQGGSIIKRLISVLATVALLSASYMSAQAQNPTPIAPDNTGINVRDRDSAAMTAGEQSESKSDLKLTRQIRKAIMADKSLSMTAKNVKIVSSGGNVVLRGPVKSAEEKNAIGDKATAIAGADKVNNQLEIAGD
jgi:hyperosmotically inducible periplasmic protein